MQLAIFLVASLLSSGYALPAQKQWNTLIVGGKPAVQGEVPYQLAVLYDGEHHCGASLIEVQGVTVALSAAHCFPNGLPIQSLTVVAGDVSLSDSTGHEQTRQVTKLVNHEEYDFFTYNNDISLLFVDEPYEINANVKIIPLPNAGSQTTGNLVASGWGRLEHEGNKPDVLQTVEVPVVDDQTCQTAYDELGEEIFESFICAGLLGVGGKDACQGDSGGPARSVNGNYLAGVVSWGEGCADPRFPGIYTEVSHYIHWINDQVALYLQEAQSK